MAPSIQIKVRLRRVQLEVIAAGLARVEAEYHQGFAFGECPQRGEYDAPMMAALRRVRREFEEFLLGGAQSRRLRLEAVELAICGFGVRMANRAILQGGLPAPAGWTTSTSRRVLTQLEKLRKRAKRACLQSDAAEYFACQRRWRELSRWLHAQLGKPVNVFRKLRRYQNRELLDTATSLTKRQLTDEGFPLPTDRELRRQVSLALRNVKRGCRGMSVRAVLEQRSSANRYLATTVRRRLLAAQPTTHSDNSAFR